MAFDMYMGDRHEAICGQDEYLFSLASETAGVFPQLEALWSKFYSEFSLSSEQAGALIHELFPYMIATGHKEATVWHPWSYGFQNFFTQPYTTILTFDVSAIETLKRQYGILVGDNLGT